MNKALTVFAGLIIVVVLLIGGALMFFNLSFPKVGPAENIRVDATAELVARGDYLTNHVTLCVDCHSQRDWSKYAAPIIPETFGAGGEGFTREMGVPGNVYATNISPTHLGEWTDGEIIRAVRQGVNKDGEALFPIMPYPHYKHMRDEDAHAIVAYLRTLEAKESDIPERELDFPMSMIVKTIPGDADPMPAATNDIERGHYLTTIAACADCHTPMEKGKPVLQKYMAGGTAYPLPGGTVYAANITPDKETGIGSWEKDDFILRFKTFQDSTMQNMPVGESEFNTVMPWIQYSGMSEEDLGLIYDYLMSIEPVKNPMERFVHND